MRISARAVHEDRVEIRVSDTGIGISRDNLARVFEEFAQVDSPVQARIKGSGIGLPLSRRLAELLGGSLTVASEPGRGSTFILLLPLAHTPARDASR